MEALSKDKTEWPDLAIDVGEVEAAAGVHPIHVGAQLLQQACCLCESRCCKARLLLNILNALQSHRIRRAIISVTQAPVQCYNPCIPPKSETV